MEILLVVGIIAILAGIVILAINPTKQLGDARNAQRRSDVLTILNAVYQYSLDNSGALPEGINTVGSTDDCITSGIVNTDAVLASTLDELTASSTYLTDMPADPTPEGSGDFVKDYSIVIMDTGRISVCAPNAENDAVIEVTR